jgi:large subunit ribosomal protein L9
MRCKEQVTRFHTGRLWDRLSIPTDRPQPTEGNGLRFNEAPWQERVSCLTKPGTTHFALTERTLEIKMEILLIENVANLGVRGDVVTVKDGYARNFLLPRKKALPVTAGNKRQIELEKDRNIKLRAKELSDAQALKARLEAVSLKTARKTGEHGHLFGSVTNADVAELLKPQGFEIEKQAISLPHVKELGVYAVEIRLYTGVHAKVNIEVTALAVE